MHEAVPAIAAEGVSPIVRIPDFQSWMVKRKRHETHEPPPIVKARGLLTSRWQVPSTVELTGYESSSCPPARLPTATDSCPP